jgi:hypothetical protein
MGIFVRSTPSKRISRWWLIHGVVFVIFAFLLVAYRCPIYAIFHVPCPGCGITRAHLAALSLDFKKAFQYHPLFFTALPLLLYISHRNVLRKRLSDKAETIVFFVWQASFLAVYIFRILNNDVGLLFDK